MYMYIYIYTCVYAYMYIYIYIYLYLLLYIFYSARLRAQRAQIIINVRLGASCVYRRVFRQDRY